MMRLEGLSRLNRFKSSSRLIGPLHAAITNSSRSNDGSKSAPYKPETLQQALWSTLDAYSSEHREEKPTMDANPPSIPSPASLTKTLQSCTTLPDLTLLLSLHGPTLNQVHLMLSYSRLADLHRGQDPVFSSEALSLLLPLTRKRIKNMTGRPRRLAAILTSLAWICTSTSEPNERDDPPPDVNLEPLKDDTNEDITESLTVTIQALVESASYSLRNATDEDTTRLLWAAAKLKRYLIFSDSDSQDFSGETQDPGLGERLVEAYSRRMVEGRGLLAMSTLPSLLWALSQLSSIDRYEELLRHILKHLESITICNPEGNGSGRVNPEGSGSGRARVHLLAHTALLLSHLHLDSPPSLSFDIERTVVSAARWAVAHADDLSTAGCSMLLRALANTTAGEAEAEREHLRGLGFVVESLSNTYASHLAGGLSRVGGQEDDTNQRSRTLSSAAAAASSSSSLTDSLADSFRQAIDSPSQLIATSWAVAKLSRPLDSSLITLLLSSLVQEQLRESSPNLVPTSSSSFLVPMASLGPEDLSRLLWILASLPQPLPHSSDSYPTHGISVRSLMAWLEAEAVEWAPSMDDQSLITTLCSYATLNQPCPRLLEAASSQLLTPLTPRARAQKRVSRIKPRHFPRLLWSVAKLLQASCRGHNDHGGASRWDPGYESAAAGSDLRFKGGEEAEDQMVVAGGLGLGGVSALDLIKTMGEILPLTSSSSSPPAAAAAADDDDDKMSPQGLAMTAWSFSASKIRPSDTSLDLLARKIASSAQQLDPQGLAMACSSLSNLKPRDVRVIGALGAEVMRRLQKDEEGRGGSSGSSSSSAALSHGSTFSAPALASIACSLSKSRALPQDIETFFLLISRSILNSDTLYSSPGKVRGEGRGGGGRALEWIQVLWSISNSIPNESIKNVFLNRSSATLGPPTRLGRAYRALVEATVGALTPMRDIESSMCQRGGSEGQEESSAVFSSTDSSSVWPAGLLCMFLTSCSKSCNHPGDHALESVALKMAPKVEELSSHSLCSTMVAIANLASWSHPSPFRPLSDRISPTGRTPLEDGRTSVSLLPPPSLRHALGLQPHPLPLTRTLVASIYGVLSRRILEEGEGLTMTDTLDLSWSLALLGPEMLLPSEVAESEAAESEARGGEAGGVADDLRPPTSRQGERASGEGLRRMSWRLPPLLIHLLAQTLGSTQIQAERQGRAERWREKKRRLEILQLMDAEARPRSSWRALRRRWKDPHSSNDGGTNGGADTMEHHSDPEEEARTKRCAMMVEECIQGLGEADGVVDMSSVWKHGPYGLSDPVCSFELTIVERESQRLQLRSHILVILRSSEHLSLEGGVRALGSAVVRWRCFHGMQRLKLGRMASSRGWRGGRAKAKGGRARFLVVHQEGFMGLSFEDQMREIRLALQLLF